MQNTSGLACKVKGGSNWPANNNEKEACYANLKCITTQHVMHLRYQALICKYIDTITIMAEPQIVVSTMATVWVAFSQVTEMTAPQRSASERQNRRIMSS